MVQKDNAFILPDNNKKLIFLNLIGFCGGAILFFIPYIIIWSLSFSKFSLFNLVLFTFMLGLGLEVHELLHGIGFIVFGNLKWKNLKFGIKNKGLIFYTHCSIPVKMYVYRIAILLPGILLGVFPAIVGIFLGIDWVVLYGVIMFSGAVMDFIIAWKSRVVESKEYVVDHSSKIGFKIIKDKENVNYLKKKAEEEIEKNNLMKCIRKGILYLFMFVIVVIVFYYLGYIVGRLFG